MNLTLSINNRYKDKDLKKISYGWENKTLTLQELVNYIEKGIGYCGGVIDKEITHKKKPAKHEIEYSKILCLDFDNDKGNKYFSVQDAINDEFISKYGILLHETLRSTPERNRFRILLLLDKPCFQDEFENINEYFIRKYNCDESCKDFSKVYAGNSKAKCILFSCNEINTQEILDLNYTYHEPTYDYKNYSQPDLTTLQASEMLDFIPKQQSYNEWYAVCKDVLDYFGLNEGVKLIENWSPCYDKMSKKENTLHWAKSIEINRIDFPKVLYTYAKKNGWVDTRSRKTLNTAKPNNDKDNDEEKKIGKNLQKLLEVEEFLSSIGKFSYNVIKQRPEYLIKGSKTKVILEDRHVNGFWIEMLKQGNDGISPILINRVIDSPFAKDTDPFIEYFNSLPKWDGVSRIQQLAETMPVEENNKLMRNDYLQKWLVGVVAQATLRGRNHLCLTLVGGQGWYKNTFFNSIIPPDLREDYFTERNINPDSDDDKSLLTNTMLIMMDELESVTKKELGSLKGVMTQNIFNFRLPYGRRAVVLKRRASFSAGVNRTEFLNDITGNRRFIIIELNKAIEIGMVESIDLTQLWAEAKHLLDNKFRYWYEGYEVDIINERNKDYNIASPEEENISIYFEPATEHDTGAKFLSATEISNYIKKHSQNNLWAKNLGVALTNLGYKYKRTGNKRGYWVFIKTLEFDYNHNTNKLYQN